MPPPSRPPFRPIRSHVDTDVNDESPTKAERVPFLTQEQSFDHSSDLENGAFRGPAVGSSESLKFAPFSVTQTAITDDDLTSSRRRRSFFSIKPRWLWRTFSLVACLCSTPKSFQKTQPIEKDQPKKKKVSPLRRVLRLLAIALMLLGIVEFVILACGLLTAFFPDELDDTFDAFKPSGRLPSGLGRWPTDFSADVQPVACHSHNDYWRKEPLFSALNAGCTGVEADVWLFDQDLFVGHSTASLTPERTFRNLYVNPLLDILNKQNPKTAFHPSLDTPRNGVFDTVPSQTLVLLVDFKTDGDILWRVVSEQLQPLREQKFLTYFNGSSVIEGPITVVVTGNAPFSAVVANPNYRDMFFDAPLDLMEQLSDIQSSTDVPAHHSALDHVGNLPTADGSQDQNQGQGYSGSAPLNPSVYSRANSYYTSLDFQHSFGYLWRGHLTRQQKEKLRKQIAGAHSRGLKVRYWGVPNWPRGLRNYLWRVLVREGVDYLNVDDLHSATTGKWGWGDKHPWWSGPWKFWRAPSS